MILVDVYVPAMDKVYDFRLDETASVAQIMKEMEEIFMKKVKETKMEKQQEFMLCSMEQKKYFQYTRHFLNVGLRMEAD